MRVAKCLCSCLFALQRSIRRDAEDVPLEQAAELYRELIASGFTVEMEVWDDEEV